MSVVVDRRRRFEEERANVYRHGHTRSSRPALTEVWSRGSPHAIAREPWRQGLQCVGELEGPRRRRFSVHHLDLDDEDDVDSLIKSDSDQTLMSEKGWIGTGLARCLCSLPLVPRVARGLRTAALAQTSIELVYDSI